MEEFIKILKENGYDDNNIKTFLDNVNLVIKDYEDEDNALLNKGIEIAKTIMPLKLDVNSIISCVILPFVVKENTLLENIKENEEAYNLVSQVIKLDRIDYTSDKAEAEYLRAMFVAIAKDIRVIVIKLAQMLINAQLTKNQKSTENDKLFYEIQEIYAPLAARLGLSFIKTSLFNLCLAYYKPLEYKKLLKDLSEDVALRQNTIEKVTVDLKDIVSQLKINGYVYGRIKSPYSIYNKLKSKNLQLGQIYDIVALRVLVENINDCYAVLGAVHTKFMPLDGRFKDYIAKPKANGYQSLHTTVIVDGIFLEIQIRTFDMHNHAEYGIAAHWLYKEHKSKMTSLDDKLMWIRKIIENSDNASASDLINELKTDVYADEIFVQTPQGKIIQLVENSTPVDFAYNIHSEIGNKCVGAKVNGKMVPLTHTLNNGDIVEIITSTNSKGPSRDWLKTCKTTQAKNKINAFFKKEMKEDNIKKGKAILEQACKLRNLNPHDLFIEKYLFDLYERYSLKSLDECYANVGYGSITSTQIINRLYNSYKQDHGLLNKKVDTSNLTNTQSVGEIEGLDGIMVKFAKCCNPIPGDDIVGFISRGNGVTIHRKDCASLHQFESDRIMNLSWGNQEENNSYNAGLQILVTNTAGVLAEITNKISDSKINITYINSENAKDGNVMINVGISVKNKDQLAEIVNKIKSMANVLDIRRGVNK